MAPFRLEDLPSDLQLRVADSVDCPCERALLCLAHPRLFFAARTALPRYRELVLRVGMQLVLGEIDVGETTMRRYVRDYGATYDGVVWLNTLLQDAGMPGLVTIWPSGQQYWSYILNVDEAPVALRSDRSDGAVIHYAGENCVDRMARIDQPDGSTNHFEGEPGAERLVRVVDSHGHVIHLEGERLAERITEIHPPTGLISFYEGEPRVERLVRMETPDGSIFYFEGAKGCEAMVRFTTRDVNKARDWALSCLEWARTSSVFLKLTIR